MIFPRKYGGFNQSGSQEWFTVDTLSPAPHRVRLAYEEGEDEGSQGHMDLPNSVSASASVCVITQRERRTDEDGASVEGNRKQEAANAGE